MFKCLLMKSFETKRLFLSSTSGRFAEFFALPSVCNHCICRPVCNHCRPAPFLCIISRCKKLWIPNKSNSTGYSNFRESDILCANITYIFQVMKLISQSHRSIYSHNNCHYVAQALILRIKSDARLLSNKSVLSVLLNKIKSESTTTLNFRLVLDQCFDKLCDHTYCILTQFIKKMFVVSRTQKQSRNGIFCRIKMRLQVFFKKLPPLDQKQDWFGSWCGLGICYT